MAKEIEIPEGYEAKIENNKVIFVPKESEDEKIRKELLKEIEFITPRDGETDGEGLILPSYHARIDRYKSYLEKQKDILGERAQNITANMLEDRIKGIQRELIEFLSNTVNASWVDVIQSADAYAERIRDILEKQKEQKPAEQLGGTFTSYDMAKTFTEGQNYVIAHPEKFGLCKTAEWSEEDERTLESFLGWLQGSMGEKTYSSWLKSLPERFSLKPKQEWSEEDSRILYNVIAYVGYAAGQRGVRDDLFKEANDWLKSLHPQHHWKPSEGQIEALENSTALNEEQGVHLYSLLCDLKKLL